MTFLAPWFLLGALAIGGPILFHLIRRIVRHPMPFSSLLFLRPTPPRVKRRRKVEHFWLLLLRCLCVLLLATAFARPFFYRELPLPVSKSGGRQLLLLIDTSASMQREGLWANALNAARRHLAKSSPSDQVAIVAFDRGTRTVLSFDDWSLLPPKDRVSAAEQRLQNLAPSQMGTRLGPAFIGAAEQFLNSSVNTAAPEEREIVVISDLQEGARLDGLQGYDWPNGIRVRVEPIEARHRGNAGLSVVTGRPGAAGNRALQVRVSNSRDSVSEKFEIAFAAANSERRTVYVPAGQTKTFSLTNDVAAGHGGQLRLAGDAETFDNAVHVVNPAVDQANVVWLGADSPDDPKGLRFYIERVFAGASQPTRIVPSAGEKFSTDLLKDAALMFVSRNLSAGEAEVVRNAISGGKTAFMVLSSEEMTPTFAALSGLPDVRVTESRGDYSLLAHIDFAHPIFAPFADPRFSDFTGIHFWKHRRWEVPSAGSVRVLAKFDDDSSALAQLSVGKGTLLVLASGWNPGDSQFAVSSKFPPLMQALLNSVNASGTRRFQFLTGDAIPGPATAEATVQWQNPNGKVISLEGAKAFSETDMPGIYTARFAGRERSFAVNLPAEESRTASMPVEELARLGVPIQMNVEKPAATARIAARQLQRAEQESQQKFWRWLIVGALVAVLGETILSGWLAGKLKSHEIAEPTQSPIKRESPKEFA